MYTKFLTFDEIMDVLYNNYCARSIGYTLQPGIYDISDIKLMLNCLLPDEVKVIITIDDIILRSNLTTNKTITFTKKLLYIQLLKVTQEF